MERQRDGETIERLNERDGETIERWRDNREIE
jgi:hypothetical protein